MMAKPIDRTMEFPPREDLHLAPSEERELRGYDPRLPPRQNSRIVEMLHGNFVIGSKQRAQHECQADRTAHLLDMSWAQTEFGFDTVVIQGLTWPTAEAPVVVPTEFTSDPPGT